MATTVDHLGDERWVRVLRSFEDAAGNRFEAGETGWIRRIHLDRATFDITIDLEQGASLRQVVLFNMRHPGDVPRSGRMKEYFEVTGLEYRQEPKPEGAAAYDEDLSTRPAWYRAAVALEKRDRFDEAEACIRAAIPHAAFTFTVAEMYRERMLRLWAAGDAAGAEKAKAMSLGAAYFYASMATSGGEGTAMKRECEAFVRSLGLDRQ